MGRTCGWSLSDLCTTGFSDVAPTRAMEASSLGIPNRYTVHPSLVQSCLTPTRNLQSSSWLALGCFCMNTLFSACTSLFLDSFYRKIRMVKWTGIASEETCWVGSQLKCVCWYFFLKPGQADLLLCQQSLFVDTKKPLRSISRSRYRFCLCSVSDVDLPLQ